MLLIELLKIFWKRMKLFEALQSQINYKLILDHARMACDTMKTKKSSN